MSLSCATLLAGLRVSTSLQFRHNISLYWLLGGLVAFIGGKNEWTERFKEQARQTRVAHWTKLLPALISKSNLDST